jgi:quinoprotein glucose dehydrogenase
MRTSFCLQEPFLMRVFPSCLSLFFILTTLPALAQDSPGYKPYTRATANPPKDALRAMQQIRIPQGMKIDLFAAEPLLGNPVCFWIDEHGRIYVAETYRIHAGVEDDRDHMNWLADDMAARTVADRVTMFKKYLGDRVKDGTIQEDRIRLIEDTKGTGRADRSTIFADGFRGIEDGIGAGLLSRNGTVWYTCIPNLYKLRNSKGTGRADERQVLHSGYGIHVASLGHDLHGLRFGPDGKLYFSIGDRGLNVFTEGRRVANIDSGAVLRCDPDGSGLEIVATGLRNPQELAFDQYGNLFTGDNNADHGDKARWVYVVEGGDSGWRTGFQYLTKPVALGPWNAEKLWLPEWKGQAAYIVPPIANVADGPAGLAYYPGVGLPERYREHFFLCDFRGSSGLSGIRSFAVQPRGASFEFVDQHQFVWSVLATDVDFGPDCAMYILDWIDGWDGTQRGRIYRMTDPNPANSSVVAEVKRLLGEGMAKRSDQELAHLLEHADMRVRQEAQFALAERGLEGSGVFLNVAQHSSNRLARLHAIWGLGQIGRKSRALVPLIELLKDKDSEVRAQAAKTLGDTAAIAAFEPLVKRLEDPEPRVRFFAAQGLGKLGHSEASGRIVDMLRANNDQDVYLRHAGVVALARLHDLPMIQKAARDNSRAVRLAGLLALRRLESPEIAQFLNDTDPELVLEAARAINDVPIDGTMPALAALIDRSSRSDPLLDRVLNANFRLGKPENALALAAFAARQDVSDRLRREACEELLDWAKPSGLDRIMGLWRPLEPRSEAMVREAVAAHVPALLQGSDGLIQLAARLIAKLQLKEAGPILSKIAANSGRFAFARVEALRALEKLDDPGLPQAMQRALSDGNDRLRTEGRRLLAKTQPAQACALAARALDGGSVSEQQGAFALLGNIPHPAADDVLEQWLDRLQSDKVPVEIRLDLLEAVARQPKLKNKLAEYEHQRQKGGVLDRFRETLAGGDADAGREIFYHKAEVNCQRCHRLHGDGGEVGPDLTGIGGRQKREYLLESILDPSKEIAKGFETAVLVPADRNHQVGGCDRGADHDRGRETGDGPQKSDRGAPAGQIGHAGRRGEVSQQDGVTQSGRVPG